MNNTKKWVKEYTENVDLNKIEWIKLNAEDLKAFFDNNYLDKKTWEYVCDKDANTIYPTILGMNYLNFDNPINNKKYSYLLGIVSNSIGKKTVVAATIYIDKYFINLIESGVDFINISYHKDDEFISYNQLKHIWDVFKKYSTSNQKLRINTNVWKGNHDEFDSLLSWLEHISLCCNEIRLSNIIHKDNFSVNPNTVSEANNMYMTDDEYEQLFGSLVKYFEKDYTIIYNPEALGFVHYYLIPRPVPIIVNWNIDSKVSEQVCENDIEHKKIHTVKCLITGDISLSWNTGNIIKL